MSTIINEYLEIFLEAAIKDLRQNGVPEEKVRAFSEAFRRRAKMELELNQKFNPELLSDVEEFIDDVLRLTITGLDPEDKEMKEATGNLWGLRAEKGLQRLERQEKGQSGHIIEFKKLR